MATGSSIVKELLDVWILTGYNKANFAMGMKDSALLMKVYCLVCIEVQTRQYNLVHLHE